MKKKIEKNNQKQIDAQMQILKQFKNYFVTERYSEFFEKINDCFLSFEKVLKKFENYKFQWSILEGRNNIDTSPIPNNLKDVKYFTKLAFDLWK